jgi:hypothetical protein
MDFELADVVHNRRIFLSGARDRWVAENIYEIDDFIWTDDLWDQVEHFFIEAVEGTDRFRVSEYINGSFHLLTTAEGIASTEVVELVHKQSRGVLIDEMGVW